jgi:hypothetical protein
MRILLCPHHHVHHPDLLCPEIRHHHHRDPGMRT